MISLGTVPVWNEVLKIISNGLEIIVLRNLSILILILKGPTAFPLFKLEISSSISLLVVGKCKNCYPVADEDIP